MPKSFLHLRKLSGAPIPTWRIDEQMALTTKRTKDTKGSDIYTPKLRALRGLRGEMSVRTLVAALPRWVSAVNTPSQ
jgi:hypothetical protein